MICDQLRPCAEAGLEPSTGSNNLKICFKVQNKALFFMSQTGPWFVYERVQWVKVPLHLQISDWCRLGPARLLYMICETKLHANFTESIIHLISRIFSWPNVVGLLESTLSLCEGPQSCLEQGLDHQIVSFQKGLSLAHHVGNWEYLYSWMRLNPQKKKN